MGKRIWEMKENTDNNERFREKNNELPDVNKQCKKQIRSTINKKNVRKWTAKWAQYRGGPHMRSLISIDFPAPEMEPESAHVASAVSVP